MISGLQDEPCFGVAVSAPKLDLVYPFDVECPDRLIFVIAADRPPNV